MLSPNAVLVEIMADRQLNVHDIAKQLGVESSVVERWIAFAENLDGDEMPESELRLLRYALMTDNKRKHLF